MKRFRIEVSDQAAKELAELARRCSEADRAREGATTDGALTVAALLTMLANDAAMVIRRPGSWEGSGMAELLTSHGYEV